MLFAEEGMSASGECLGAVQEKIMREDIFDLEEERHMLEDQVSSLDKALQNAEQVCLLTSSSLECSVVLTRS